MIEIQRVPHEDGSSCLDETIAAFMNWLGIEYMVIYKRCWFFQYSAEEKKIGQRLAFEIAWGNDMKAAGPYCGVYFHSVLAGDEDFLQRIKEELESGRPVLLLIDAYWCPWLTAYQVRHLLHDFILIGMNHDALIGTDSYYSQDRVELPLELLKQGAVSASLYRLGPRQKTCDVKEILKEFIHQFCSVSSLENLELFQEDMRDLTFFQEIQEPYEESSFYLWFDRYRNNRRKIPMLLKWLQRQSSLYDLSRCISVSEKLYLEWVYLHKLLLKANLSRQYAGKTAVNIQEHLKNLLHFERSLWEELQNIMVGGCYCD